MKKLYALLAVISLVSIFLLSACKSDPEKSTRKDMLKCGEFYYDYNDNGDDSYDFKLTFKKDYTYSLYIKDYEASYHDVIMKTYTGKWSNVFTYEYEYDTSVSHVGIFSKTKKAILCIYLLEGYVYKDSEGIEKIHYFGYEKGTGKGTLFTTDKIIDKQFLESYRDSSHAHVSHNLGPIELPGFLFESRKK